MQDRSPLLLVVIVAVAAAALPAYRAANSAQATGGQSTAPPADAAFRPAEGARPTAPVLEACQDAPQPLRPLCDVFQPGTRATGITGSWLETARGDVRSLVVLVSDPVVTGDRLRFDRTIESIQNAAASTRYTFDRFWLPWSAGARANSDREEETRPTLEPGLLLFRSSGARGRHLAVFLVGESPVQGVNREAFRRAIHYMSELSATRPLDRVDLAGPNFSGSFGSLGQAIDEVASDVASFRVISPSATGEPPVRFRDKEPTNKNPSITYRSTVHSDEFVRQRLDSYLGSRWSTAGQAVVTLSETNTVFGLGFGAPSGAPSRLAIQFPRQIAKLRAAHPEATPKSLFTQAGGTTMGNERLPVPLKDPQIGPDSVPTFAAQQRPVAQEAMLLEIVSVLEQRRTPFVQIVATDVLDTIFLGGFLRQAYPDARILVVNADMLFVRAADRLPLSGTLALTAFPLFLRNQFWIQPGGAEPRRLWPMGSRFEFGLFNSCRTLLLEQRPGLEPALTEYHLPAYGYSSAPPLWLTVVGTGGYWPIALLDFEDRHPSDSYQFTWALPQRGRTDKAIDVGRPAPSWEIVFWILTVGGLVLTVFVAWSLLPSDRLRRGLPRVFRVTQRQVGWAGMSCITVAGCLSLAGMIFAMSSPLWWLASRGHLSAWANPGVVASKAAFATATAAGMAFFLMLIAGRAWSSGSDRYSRGYGLLAAAFVGVFGVFVFGWQNVVGSGQHLEPLFLAYRSLDLLNGVSPVVPLLLLGAGLVMFALLHGLRHAIYLEMAPALPRLAHGAVASRIERRVGAVRDVMGHPLLSGSPAAWMLFLLGASSVLFLWPLFLAPPQSLEARAYDYLYGGALLLLYGLVLLAWARFLFAWHNLHAVLGALERHPVRLALNELPHGYSALPILQGTGTYSVPGLLRRSVETLRLLANTPSGGDSLAPFESGETRRSLGRRLKEIEAGVDAYEALGTPLTPVHACLREAGDLIAGELDIVWARGSSETLERAGDVRTATVVSLPAPVIFGREFIAVQYVMFACNAIRQLRNMLFYLTTGFFLGVVSVLVYPFRSQERLAWVATANFVILGLPIILAIVQMERDETLKRLTDPARKSGMGTLLLRLAAYGALPVLGLVSSHVPAIGRFLTSMLEPALRTLP